MQFIWRLLTGCDWQESRTELRHYYTSHRKRLALLFIGTLGWLLLIRLLNDLIGPLPAIPNPTMANMPGFSGEYCKFNFGFLAFPGIVALMILLPPTASYPVDITRVTLLPRKIYCIILSIPLALSYAMEGWFDLQFFIAWWGTQLRDIGLHMLTVIAPTAVLASFLNDIKASRNFRIASSAWLLCHVTITVIAWGRLPINMWFQPTISHVLVGYATAVCALALLVWHRTRCAVFVAGCLLAITSYVLHWSVYSYITSHFGQDWGFGVFWVVSWFSAGATCMPQDNWTVVVGCIP